MTKTSFGIDTLKVGFKISPDEIDFEGWIHTVKPAARGQSGRKKAAEDWTKKHIATNGAVIQLTFHLFGMRGEIANLLLIEFSLPRLVHGRNCHAIDNLDAAYDVANGVISGIPGLPTLPDIRQAALHRIDLYVDFQVAENVTAYLQALQKAQLPQRQTVCYHHTGIQFRAKEITTTLYDKYEECHDEETRGILRLEETIRKRRKVSGTLGKDCQTLGDVSFGLIRGRMLKIMRMLNLDKPIKSDQSEVELILRERYSGCRVLTLLSFLNKRQIMSREQLVAQGIGPSSIRYYEKLLSDAGISINSNSRMHELEALTTLFDECENSVEITNDKNFSLSPSDTKTPSSTSYLEGSSYAKGTRSQRRRHLQSQGWTLVAQGHPADPVFSYPARGAGSAPKYSPADSGGFDTCGGPELGVARLDSSRLSPASDIPP